LWEISFDEWSTDEVAKKILNTNVLDIVIHYISL
jgi:hypothetical protein